MIIDGQQQMIDAMWNKMGKQIVNTMNVHVQLKDCLRSHIVNQVTWVQQGTFNSEWFAYIIPVYAVHIGWYTSQCP